MKEGKGNNQDSSASPNKSSNMNQLIGINVNMVIMISRILKYSLLFIILILIFDLYHLYQYVRVSNQIKSAQKVLPRDLLNHLQYLTGPNMPFFREKFYQEYVFELAKNKEWIKVTQQAQIALSYESNGQKFSLHYHKAMALCFLQRFKQCKLAIQRAHIYSTKQKLDHIQSIYSILLSNNMATHEQVPNGAQFEPPKSDSSKKTAKMAYYTNLQTL